MGRATQKQFMFQFMAKVDCKCQLYNSGKKTLGEK